MRNPEEILADICTAFGTDLETYKNRGQKKVTDKMSLITQAYIYIMSHISIINLTELGRTIDRSSATVTLMKQKAEILLACKHPYAEDFKNRIATSCDEGKMLMEKYHNFKIN